MIENTTHLFYQRAVERLGAELPSIMEGFEKFRPRLEKGQISNEQFWFQLSKFLGIKFEPSMLTLWSENFEAETPPIPGVLDLADEIKAAGYKLGMLSNTTEPHVAINRTRHIFEHFDVALMSNEIGARKPEPEAYYSLLTALDAEAEETVFIDDLAENVAGAEAVGIKGIKFEGVEPLRTHLEQLGIKL